MTPAKELDTSGLNWPLPIHKATEAPADMTRSHGR